MIKSATKTAMKKVISAAALGNSDEAKTALKGALSAIDKAYSKGIYHKNAAARKKSHLARLVNKLN